MAKRVFEIAKDLGVESRVILEKCHAEGIPNRHNHMSQVGAALEATIRAWFDAEDPEQNSTLDDIP